MNDETIKAIVEELAPLLNGRSMGKVFQLSRTSLAIDFRLKDGRYLFISVDPGVAPRLYLIERRVRELEKQSLQSTSFVLALKKHLSGAELVAVTKDEGDRIVRFSFRGRDAIGNILERVLVAQLTGRAANLLLLNEHGYIIDTLRHLRGEGQEAVELYIPPAQAGVRTSKTVMERGSFPSLSEAADNYYRELEAKRAFEARVAAERSRLNKEITQRVKLKRHLEGDLAAHGDAEEHKRIGDLLLANLATAQRHGSRIVVTDYYTEGAPQVELEVDENISLQKEAARRFARYTKARRAGLEIAERLAVIEKELKKLEAQREELESITRARDHEALAALTAEPKRYEDRRKDQKKKQAEQVTGARRYTSSDGYEILVGRAARDNDNLTFRVARPHDLWLHAADYPGSHVIVRNPTRAEIPHRTLIEAAQLAAHFSQARNDTKVSVHYSQRKFLSKPKGSAPGLVRMSSFRTITVAPKAVNRES
ncbi:MAG TPA: NFACT family protein [Pyrinomonadaceae bacterium]|jgi:predicted ribosome quality control (RQC) complex YloA/Tae2 family protein